LCIRGPKKFPSHFLSCGRLSDFQRFFPVPVLKLRAVLVSPPDQTLFFLNGLFFLTLFYQIDYRTFRQDFLFPLLVSLGVFLKGPSLPEARTLPPPAGDPCLPVLPHDKHYLFVFHDAPDLFSALVLSSSRQCFFFFFLFFFLGVLLFSFSWYSIGRPFFFSVEAFFLFRPHAGPRMSPSFCWSRKVISQNLAFFFSSHEIFSPLRTSKKISSFFFFSSRSPGLLLVCH